ncbi:MAG: hypothetical protein AB7Y46_04790 [Armatimonadota bacterium]
MRMVRISRSLVTLLALQIAPHPGAQEALPVVEIRGEDFFIDGRPTYEGVSWRGHRVEGLLLNSRMVQGTFDDENPDTRALWAYPDTGEWDPERNADEFVAAMPSWREHGLLAFTLNLQGGGHIYAQPFPYDQYINSACDPQGQLKPAYMARLGRILDRAAQLRMAVILGLAYFGMDYRYFEGPDAVRRMADEVVDWLAARGNRHVLIEIANEATRIRSRTDEVSALELMERIRARSREAYGDGFTLLCATSLGGGGMHSDEYLQAMDFVLVHGNGRGPEQHVQMIEAIRANPVFAQAPKPIVFNEAHTDLSCLRACLEHHASWGYFDQGTNNYRDGFQTPPVQWAISTQSKRRFFEFLRGVTRSEDPQCPDSPVHIRGFEGLPEGPVSGRVVVSAAIDDRWGVREVEFLVDGERINIERRYPYYLGGDTDGRPAGFDTSRLTPGEHTLRTVVRSVSGATSEIEQTFVVAGAQ